MEIPASETKVRVGGNVTHSSYTVAQNKHMFDILSSGLYSDKPRAIVRELACNAWDAHVETGRKDKPFILCLPNHIEPYFKIRDFGPGLSEFQILGDKKNGIPGLYTTYGESTKQGSNDQIGCFGLGSKSPFAYTKSWNVVSYQNGVKKTYINVVADTGVPDCFLVSTEETDEPDGLEVFFAVKKGDMYDFQDAAEKVLRVFDTMPEVRGIRKFEITPFPEPLMEGAIWKVFKGSTPVGMPEQIAIMGGVEYPLTERRGFSPNAKAVLSLPIMVKFPIGSFEVTPSRESISWTDYSEKNVNQILEDIYDELAKRISSEISGAPTLWEARKMTYKLLHNSALKKLKVVPTWNGQKVTSQVKVPEGNVVYRLFSSESYREGVCRMSCKTNKVARIDPVETEFFLADFKSAMYRTSGYVRDFSEEGKHVYLIETSSRKALKALLKEIGISQKDLRYASSIPKKQRTHSGGGGNGGSSSKHAGTRSKVFRYNGRAGSPDACWDKHSVEMDDGGVYVQIHRYKVADVLHYCKDAPMDPSRLCSLVANLGTLGIKVDLIGVKTAKIEKFENHPGWVPFEDFLIQEVRKVWENDHYLRIAHWHYNEREEEAADENDRRAQVAFVEGVEKLYKKLEKSGYVENNPDSKIVKFFEIVSKVVEKKDKAASIAHLKPWYSQQLTLVSHFTNQARTDYRSALLKHYPLLRIAEGSDSYYDSGFWNRNKVLDHLGEYVKFMDGLRANGVKV